MALRQFWDDRRSDGSPSWLAKAVGVYVWTVKEDGRRIPWNVGITSKQGFKGRFPQKEASFLRFREGRADCEIEVYLLVRQSRSGKASRSSNNAQNDWLETMLIASALKVNPDLKNTAKSKFLRSVTVDGYWNDNIEQSTEASKSFGRLFKVHLGKRKNGGSRR